MPMRDYLELQNAGWQFWQMLRSNTTRGNHPYNFFGFCMALVTQWLLEIECGGNPVNTGVYLLNGQLGRHGYGGIATTQGNYGTNYVPGASEANIVTTISGSMLTYTQGNWCNSVDVHRDEILSKVYNVRPSQGFHLGLYPAIPYKGIIKICFGWRWRLLQWAIGNQSHVMGIHCDGTNTYVFDPNYGVFIFNSWNRLYTFLADVWQDYNVYGGRVSDIT